MAEAEGEFQFASMKDIKVGRYIIIDGVPCRVVDIETSAPGKHGPAKMRVTGIGIFDGQKKTLLKSSDGETEVPVIKKRKAQVVSVSDKSAQLMDSETFEVYDISTEGFTEKLNAGAEVEVMEAMGRKALARVLSG
ncbi:MAG: translation initiation factor IF-5A [Candidatus Micrarchaeota archaeon]|nr:translation initiation factor IF-5A [Candidatus Micrarchaeota archaeon]